VNVKGRCTVLAFDFTRCVLRLHSMSVDLTLFPSDALHSFGLQLPVIVLGAYFTQLDTFPLD
jgi:hypothetical protein